ncbi:hypothetical protein C8R45DRAFT_948397 [Mycena sanguinolenta]|nr:hypothetical protein C8R45DRAFT_948397 [Mycena sanguinolenta]
MHDILDGSTQVQMSHAGGEFLAALQDRIEEEVSSKSKELSPDYRVRDDRTQNLVNGWKIQMERLVQVYMAWCAEADLGPPQREPLAMVEEILITVVDLYACDSSLCQVSVRPSQACTYKLEGKEDLIFSMLTTIDGNDSLKRVLRRLKTDGSEDEPTLGPSREWEDSQDGGEDYFLSQERVDKWAKDRVADILLCDVKNPCSDRWKNMIDDVTSRMWGIFDETGIFLALCRHGFVLVVVDMVRSGELSKYPLAIVNELLNAFGLKIGGGYGIGCHFKTTLGNSNLGDKAHANHFQSLVGSFHGHAHNRLCQLSFLATYVEGLGLEDLEGCERYFSRSNGLAKSVRYASKFHRRQDITTFMKQIDNLETYANLSKFLCNNYRQALKILKTEPELKQWMAREGVDDYDSFHCGGVFGCVSAVTEAPSDSGNEAALGMQLNYQARCSTAGSWSEDQL